MRMSKGRTLGAIVLSMLGLAAVVRTSGGFDTAIAIGVGVLAVLLVRWRGSGARLPKAIVAILGAATVALGGFLFADRLFTGTTDQSVIYEETTTSPQIPAVRATSLDAIRAVRMVIGRDRHTQPRERRGPRKRCGYS